MRSHLPASALCAALVLLLSAPAGAYEILKASGTGKQLNWTTWPMKFNIHTAAGPGVSNAQIVTAIRAAYKTWDNVTCSYISFSDLGTLNQASGNTKDRINTHIFVSSWNPSWNGNALAFTHTMYDPNTGKILDADIRYNPTRTWSVSGAYSAIDVQAVATHEIGHEMGLGHSAYPDATMYYATGNGNTQQRSLHSDDISAICYLYGNGGAKPPECTSPSHCAPNETCKNNKCVVGSTATKGYGSPCAHGGECKSTICLKYGANTFCSQKCDSAACPNSDKCLSLSGGGKACLPGSASMATKKLGQPCQTSMDCVSNICVSVPGKGYLCSQQCDPSKNNCPSSYYCAMTSSGGGLCIPGSKVVPPTKKSVGEACAAHDQCKGNLCHFGYCTQFCDKSKATTCPSTYVCTKMATGTKWACAKKGTTPPKKKALGEPCNTANDCDTGLCAGFGGSNACTKYCDKSSATSCPAGYKCIPVTGTDKGACVKDNTKKKLGESCANGAQCESGICAGEGFCTKLCTPSAGDCGQGFECIGAGSGKHACIKSPEAPDDEGGCSVTDMERTPGHGHLVWLLLLPLMLMLRRREG